MIALDTNVLVRLLRADDAGQVARAVTLIDSNPCWVSHTVLLELAWILQRPLGVSKQQTLVALLAILQLKSVSTPNREAVFLALARASEGMDIADALHLMVAETAGATDLATFDRKFLRQATAAGAHIRIREP